MTNPLLLQALIDDHRRDRLAAAARARLIALASCCRPSTLARTLARVRAVVTHRTRPGLCGA